METSALKEMFELSTEELIKAAVENKEGVIASNGALSLETGIEQAEAQMIDTLLKKKAHQT